MIIVNQPNSLASTTIPDATELSNAYDHKAAMLRGEGQQEHTQGGYNPFQVQETNQKDAQQQHLSNIAQFLSPVPVSQYDINNEHTPDKIDKFHKNLENDPLFKEHGDEMAGIVSSLADDVEAGNLSHEQAKSIFAQWGQEVFAPSAERHYKGTHLEHKSLHDDWEDDSSIAKKKEFK